MCRQDILPDEVDIGRPEPVTNRFLARKIFQRGHVIDQGIEPDIGDVVVIERQFNAPGKP